MKFYRGIMMENIGILVFIGMMQVLFHERGWMPNETLYRIGALVYQWVLPSCIAYVGGVRFGGGQGGTLAVLMTTGIIGEHPEVGILVAMIAAPIGGIIWKKTEELLKKRGRADLQMLTKNLAIGMLGCGFVILGHICFSPLLAGFQNILMKAVDFLIEHKLLTLLSAVVEGTKVLFLNNLINHGILVPMGMSQIYEQGGSILFLIETNPGPGMGLLLALCLAKRDQFEKYGTALFTQAIGGIHEVYFPIVLANGWLLLPVILGGMTGTFWFEYSHAYASSVVSPGSVVTMLLMAGKGQFFNVLMGILLSALVSFAVSFVVLKSGFFKKNKDMTIWKQLQSKALEDEKEEMKQEEQKKEIRKILFVCDGGIGSSAMGAAMLRKKMRKRDVTGIEVGYCAADCISEEADLIVCQQDYLNLNPLKEEKGEVYVLENLLDGAKLDSLLDELQERNAKESVSH